jgi:hypothetical protein
MCEHLSFARSILLQVSRPHTISLTLERERERKREKEREKNRERERTSLILILTVTLNSPIDHVLRCLKDGYRQSYTAPMLLFLSYLVRISSLLLLPLPPLPPPLPPPPLPLFPPPLPLFPPLFPHLPPLYSSRVKKYLRKNSVSQTQEI